MAVTVERKARRWEYLVCWVQVEGRTSDEMAKDLNTYARDGWRLGRTVKDTSDEGAFFAIFERPIYDS